MEAATQLQTLGQEFDYSDELQKGFRADTGSTGRVKKLSSELRFAHAGLCLHTARAFTEVFSQTEDEPVSCGIQESEAAGKNKNNSNLTEEPLEIKRNRLKIAC